jgi:Na+-transporting NADH:ubiquinone oxidoreductase subunit NqrF
MFYEGDYNMLAAENPNFNLCGPPIMNAAMIKMLKDLGVEDENSSLDEFS